MGTVYIDTAGSATANSGTTDENVAPITLTVHATYAGGATIQVTVNTGNLDNVVTAAGPTQSAVMFNDATNANQKIFWITAVDNVSSPKTITVSVAPTGLVAGTSTGGIGGRMVWTAANIMAALRAGDTVYFNNDPAAQAATFIDTSVPGTSAAGTVKWVGKPGAKRRLNATSTNPCVLADQNFQYFENLEFDQDGASGNAVTVSGAGVVFNDCKVSDAGGIGISFTGGGNLAIDCEITGTGADGIAISSSSSNTHIHGCYIHDVVGDGIEISSGTASVTLFGNIIANASARGVFCSSAAIVSTAAYIQLINNTIYGCGNSGLEVTDADQQVVLIGNIIHSNGNAAGEANVEWAAGAAEYIGFHGWNCFYHPGTGGASNLSGLTANSTEITVDPKLVDPGNYDFRLQSGSGARGTGFPTTFTGGSAFPGSMDMGAVQRIEGQILGTGAYSISGVSYSSAAGVNSILPSAAVYLCRLNSGIVEVVDSDTSHAVTGAYTLSSPYNTADHFIIVHKADAPHKFGVTDIELTPA